MRGILGVETRLDRVAARCHVALRERERLAARHAELPLHDVDAVHLLGHRMLDLEPRVDLEEVDLATVHQHLDGARSDVPDRAGEADRRFEESPAHFRREIGRGRLLHHLLVPSLRRAVALAEVEHRAVLVGQQLHLDVARAVERALEQQPRVAERRERLRRGSGERLA